MEIIIPISQMENLKVSTFYNKTRDKDNNLQSQDSY